MSYFDKSSQRLQKPQSLLVVLLIATLASLVACGSDGNGTPSGDGGNSDAPPVGPGGVRLFPCTTPGQPCNAHDNCAINPVCGEDLLCRADNYQNCDDGLACTEDLCEGQGKCGHVPKEGTCALSIKGTDGKSQVQCFAAEDRNPDDSCQTCNPDLDTFKWSSANGGFCDDGDDCTKDDYCDNGICRGTSFLEQCQDKFSCTEDLCDGKGGCVGNPLRADSCLIGETCYKDGDTDAQGCNVCDISKSTSAWTPLSVHCLIDSICYKPGEKDPTQCAICDPDKDLNAWTPIPGLCKIDGACYKAGDLNTGGCADCDPTVNASEWTVKGDFCYINKQCKNPGDTDATACGECVPATDKYAFTPLSDKCLINGLCYTPGQTDVTGCGACDPTKAADAWTVSTDVCLISDACYQPGDQDTTGCAECQPATSKTAFTPLANKCLIGKLCYANQAQDSTQCLTCDYASSDNAWSSNGTSTSTVFDFESGQTTGFSISNTDAAVGWRASNIRPAGGGFSLYYGDPAAGNYAGSGANSGTALTPAVTLAAGKKAGVRFWLYMDVESSSSYDTLTVSVVDGSAITPVWQKNITSSPTPKQWTEIHVDLSGYAGKTIHLQFAFDTTDGVGNSTEGTYVDDITLYDGC